MGNFKTFATSNTQFMPTLGGGDWVGEGRPSPKLVLVAFSSRARILGECSTIYSPPARFVVVVVAILLDFVVVFS